MTPITKVYEKALDSACSMRPRIWEAPFPMPNEITSVTIALKIDEMIQKNKKTRSNHCVRISHAIDLIAIYLTPNHNVLFMVLHPITKGASKTLYEGIWVDDSKETYSDVAVRVARTNSEETLFHEREIEISKLFQGKNVIPDLKESFEVAEENSVVSPPNTTTPSTPKKQYFFIESLYWHDLSFLKRSVKSGITDKNLFSIRIPLFFFQILRIVKIFHNQGLVIRDLKLENLLRSKFDEIKMCDFEFVYKYNPPEESEWAECGYTPNYLSPESAKRLLSEDKTSNSPPTDIWTAGVTLTELLFHEKILKWLRPQKIFKNQPSNKALRDRLKEHLSTLTAPFPIDPNESPLGQLAIKCLHPNPEERPTAEQILQDPLLRQSLTSSPAFRKFLENKKLSIDDVYTALFGINCEQIFLEFFEKKLKISTEYFLQLSLENKNQLFS